MRSIAACISRRPVSRSTSSAASLRKKSKSLGTYLSAFGLIAPCPAFFRAPQLRLPDFSVHLPAGQVRFFLFVALFHLPQMFQGGLLPFRLGRRLLVGLARIVGFRQVLHALAEHRVFQPGIALHLLRRWQVL